MTLSLSSARLSLIRHLGSVWDIPRGRQQRAEYINRKEMFNHLRPSLPIHIWTWIWEVRQYVDRLR